MSTVPPRRKQTFTAPKKTQAKEQPSSRNPAWNHHLSHHITAEAGDSDPRQSLPKILVQLMEEPRRSPNHRRGRKKRGARPSPVVMCRRYVHIVGHESFDP